MLAVVSPCPKCLSQSTTVVNSCYRLNPIGSCLLEGLHLHVWCMKCRVAWHIPTPSSPNSKSPNGGTR